MKLAGLAAAPANAHFSVLNKVAFTSKSPGGHGAVRELIDHLISPEAMMGETPKK
jgi:3-deoxy-D-manno-octulosonate 8-phosphate phosphatase (KDO 8-P phosphatase)